MADRTVSSLIPWTETGRLVDRDVQLALRLDRPPIHQHTVMLRIHLRPELGNGLAIDRHRSLENQFLTRAAGRYPRVREELLQTH